MLPLTMTPTSSNRRDLAAICWAIAANLLLFFCFAHLGVIVCFAAGWQIPRYLAPAALLCALASGDWLACREGLEDRARIVSLVA